MSPKEKPDPFASGQVFSEQPRRSLKQFFNPANRFSVEQKAEVSDENPLSESEENPFTL